MVNLYRIGFDNFDEVELKKLFVTESEEVLDEPLGGEFGLVGGEDDKVLGEVAVGGGGSDGGHGFNGAAGISNGLTGGYESGDV